MLAKKVRKSMKKWKRNKMKMTSKIKKIRIKKKVKRIVSLKMVEMKIK